MRWRWLSVAALCVSLGALALSAWVWLRRPRVSEWSRVERQHAKVVEATVAATEIAWGIAQCAERSGALPATSAKVPPAIGPIAGRQYQSRLSDWSDPAFACAGFHMRLPQRFQYQWVRGEGDDGGVVQADADFDGDGVVEHAVRLRVRCERDGGPLRCRPDPTPMEPFAPAFGPVWWE